LAATVHGRPSLVELERRYQIDLAVLSENKQKGTNAEYSENYGFVYSGIDKHKSKRWSDHLLEKKIEPDIFEMFNKF
jgi:hypothetical protein